MATPYPLTPYKSSISQDSPPLPPLSTLEEKNSLPNKKKSPTNLSKFPMNLQKSKKVSIYTYPGPLTYSTMLPYIQAQHQYPSSQNHNEPIVEETIVHLGTHSPLNHDYGRKGIWFPTPKVCLWVELRMCRLSSRPFLLRLRSLRW